MTTPTVFRIMKNWSAVWVATVALVASADVPRIMTFQGKLADLQGRFVEGQRALTFRVYDRETAGAVLWQEQQANVPVTKGIFAVPLGVYQPLNLPFDTNYWISIEVGSDGEMMPRQRLTASPYAFRSAESEHAKSADHATTATLASNAVHAVLADQATSVVSGGLPTGTILAYSGTNAPSGYFMCNGTSLSSFTYPELFAVIGTFWGPGDGSLDEFGRVRNFKLPDMRGRVISGLDVGQSEFNALGKTGGAKTHVLTVAEMPAHTHDFVANRSNNGGNNSGQPVNSDGSQVDYLHTTRSSGSGQPHNNLQPYGVANYIIKY
jgi:microcystin-dependent protein